MMALEGPLSPQGGLFLGRETVPASKLDLPPAYNSGVAQKIRDTSQTTGTSAPFSLCDVPVEIVLQVFGCLDMRSAFSLAKSNKHFKSVFDKHLDSIVLPILHRDLSPFEELLQALVAEPEDLSLPRGVCMRRTIVYKSQILCEESTSPDQLDGSNIHLRPITLDNSHIKRLLQAYKVVKGWERLFLQYRFPTREDYRDLNPHEYERLRAALYCWMTYAYYFHGGLPRPNTWMPQKDSTDPRCNILRQLSDTKLHEFEDLWMTVRSVVACEICPSTELILKYMEDEQLSHKDAEKLSFGSSRGTLLPGLTPWSDNAEWVNVNERIIDTFLKLSPAELLNLVDHGEQYSKKRLVYEVKKRHPNILDDTQSLTYALSSVLAERKEARETVLANSHHQLPTELFFPSAQSKRWNRSGGILDWISLDDRALRKFWDETSTRKLFWELDEDLDLPSPLPMLPGRLEP